VKAVTDNRHNDVSGSFFEAPATKEKKREEIFKVRDSRFKSRVEIRVEIHESKVEVNPKYSKSESRKEKKYSKFEIRGSRFKKRVEIRVEIRDSKSVMRYQKS
jgi:hypothetical protein